MLPFSDFLVMQEIKRTRPSLWEQMAAPQGQDPSMGGPDQQPMPPAPMPSPDEDEGADDDAEQEDPEETDGSTEEGDVDDKKTDIKMLKNCLHQVKTPQIKEIMRKFIKKLKHTSPSDPAAQMDNPPSTDVQPEEPPQAGNAMQDPNAQQGQAPPQGGGGMVGNMGVTS